MAGNDAASGAGYQDEYWVGAYYLAALFAEAFAEGDIGKVTRVEYQRGPLGDVVVYGDSASGQATLDLQVKRRLQVSAKRGDFPKVVRQMWKTVKDQGFKQGIDKYGLVVMRGSKPLKRLGKLAKRAAACTASGPFWTAIDDLNQGEKDVLKAVMDVSESIDSSNVKDVAWRILGSGMVVLEMDPANAESPHRAYLRSWVDSRVHSPRRTEAIVNTIYEFSSQCDKNRGSVDLAGLERKLLSSGHFLTPSLSAPMVVALESMAPVRSEELAPAILGEEPDRFDMDLRHLTSDNVLTDPDEAVRYIADENSLLRSAVNTQKDRKLILCGRSHIPLAALVGYLVGDRGDVRVLDWHPNAEDQCWNWPENDLCAYPHLIRTETGQRGTMAVRFSLSFWVGEDSSASGLPSTIERTVGILDQVVHLSHPELEHCGTLRARSVRSQLQARAYADEFRNVLDSAVSLTSKIDVFYAGPLSVAFEMGRRVASTMHPPTTVWNYEAGKYTWGICLNPRNGQGVGLPKAVFAPDYKKG
ncbi:MAG: SAVED domain-containing protein [Bacteroidetes bacterium SB0662_bin_6]|nr:SAVED domain-containing protein [Bacteroidetes bacterium SB0668_bin_1]MYE04260.1 SAVED domain-containing protein [Bacteroidetes bacterium SB0662_bin_6]